MTYFNDMWRKYACKKKERGGIIYTFQKILDKPGCKPNKIWVDKESEFYNNSFKMVKR